MAKQLLLTTALVASLASFASAQRAPGEEYIARVPGMSEYRVRKSETDAIGMTHTWADQYYRGIPVFGGEAIVHLKRDGSLSSIDEEAIIGFDAPTSVRISLTEAKSIAESRAQLMYGSRSSEPTEATLYALREGARDYLAYHVVVGTTENRGEDVVPTFWISALDGSVIRSYDSIARQAAHGQSIYYGDLYFPVVQSGQLYYMQSSPRFMQCLSARDTRNGQYDVVSISTLFDNPVYHEGAIDCWWNMVLTYEYFENAHNWVGMDNNNGPRTERLIGNQKAFTGICDYGEPGTKQSINAKFNPVRRKVYFGGAANFAGVDEFVSCDVVAHEMAHVVIWSTANIDYFGHSGSVNESIADVFGAMVERFREGETVNTWIIGEDVLGPSGTAMRDMIDPERLDQPDHDSEAIATLADFGGVHVNSGIPNRAFTLAALGGTHTNSPGSPMTGIGADKAAEVWFRALRYHMGRVMPLTAHGGTRSTRPRSSLARTPSRRPGSNRLGKSAASDLTFELGAGGSHRRRRPSCQTPSHAEPG